MAAPYNAKGDAVSTKEGISLAGNKIQIPGYTFKAADVGMLFFSDLNGGGASTITAVDTSANTATVSSTIGVATGRYMLVGHDDTAALQAALDAAAFSVTGAAVGDGTTANGNKLVFGQTVQLRAGCKYIIRNPTSGGIAALKIHRRTALIGTGGPFQAQLILAPDTYGHGIANAGFVNGDMNNAFDDFIVLKNFGMDGVAFQNYNGGDLIHIQQTFNGYQYTDNFSFIQDLQLFNAPKSALYLAGRGEIYVSGCHLFGALHGLFCDGLSDSAVVGTNASGGKASIVVHSSVPMRFTNCKAYYGGRNGGAVSTDCCNWLVTADQPFNGLTIFDACESQESRGSSWILQNTGNNQFIGCKAGDPGRQNGDIDTGTLPTVRAGFEFQGECQNNIFAGCQVGPSVSIYNTATAYSATSPYSNWGGTDAVYLGSGAVEQNVGDIYTMQQTSTRGGIVYQAGNGAVNGPNWLRAKNPGLRVNGNGPAT